MSCATITQGRLDSRVAIARPGLARQTVELLVALCLSVLVVRTFSAEAYVVPTGSMAPTLLGEHRELTCPSCRFLFVVGIDEDGQSGEPVCPNCGERCREGVPALECGGDRVLVQKFVHDVQRPRRWEVAVFHFPGDPTQAYVKRVVGLPGESIRIVRGDIFVDGKIVRKSPAEIRAMRILIHDSRYQPSDAAKFPRWQFVSDASKPGATTGWMMEDGQFAYRANRNQQRPATDWLVYRHWDPARGRYGPIRDFYAYNGGDFPAENEVPDIGLEAQICVSEAVDQIALDLRSGGDQFVLTVPVGRRGSIELVRNGRRELLKNCRNPFEDVGLWPRIVTLTASAFDHRLEVAMNGTALFDPYDYDDPAPSRTASETPIALGVRGGAVEVNQIRIYRDIYYTSSLANTPRHSQGMATAVVMGADEYFVLGDNSPVSNDSRFWTEGPVVRGSMFVGRPFLVHLPGQLVPLNVLGRSLCWVPDPRRIRYIR